MRKIIIVTGASSGMGACFAQQLAYESACFKEKAALLRRRDCSSKKAALLDEQGADELWLLARRKDKLEQTAALIENAAISFEKESPVTRSEKDLQLFPKPRAIECDISGKEGALRVKALLAAENERWNSSGGISVIVLVNNAGFGTYGEFAQTDTTREMEMVDLDCTALTGITGFVLPYLKRNARLINTASLASFLPLGNFAVYGA